MEITGNDILLRHSSTSIVIDEKKRRDTHRLRRKVQWASVATNGLYQLGIYAETKVAVSM